jgi:3-dehydroquinate synthase
VRRVEVALPGRSYPVLIGSGALGELGGFLTGKVVAIADQAVPRLPEPALAQVTTLAIAGGEGAKTLAGLESLLEGIEENRVGRDGTVVAIGGGTIGDVAAFAASIWLRGVAVVQVPTTLLAMVDSAIGGKTGVNTRSAKNAIGTFWQPRAVLVDTRFLATLPRDELEGGQAEVIKYAMTLDPGIAELDDIEEVIERCVRCKAEVVAGDERESGRREVLNYGHTVAHAIEAASGYTIHHGRAVAWGMRVAARISVGMGLCDPGVEVEQDRLLAAHGLLGERPKVTAEAILVATAGDKKSRGGRLRWVLLRGLGRAETGWEVPDEAVAGAVAGILDR